VYRIYNIQSLRGIAAILVVFSHLLIIEQKYGGTNSILPELSRFGVFGVDIFFVISGFIMVTITKGKFQSFKEMSRFISHRAARIYPIYWFYSLLVLLVFLIYPELVNSSQGNQVDILSSFLLIPSETLPLLAVGWTLIHEVYFYMVFSLILLIVNEKKLVYALLFWGVGIVIFNLFFKPSSPFITLITHPLTLEFIAGCLLAVFYFKNKIQVNSSTLFLFIALTLIASLYLFSSDIGANGLTPQGWMRPLILGIPAVLIVYFLLIAENNNLVFSKIFVTLGNASYSIYLSHILTLSVIGRVWDIFNSNSIIDNWIMIPVMFVLTCVAGVASYFWIEIPLSNKIFKKNY